MPIRILSTMNTAKTAPQQSIRFKLITSIRRLIILAFLFLGVFVFGFVVFNELNYWEARQIQLASSASIQTSDFLKRISDSLQVLAAVDPEYLAANPQTTETLYSNNPFYQEFIRLDGNGAILWNSDRSSQPVLGNLFTISQSIWFQTAAAGNSYISDIQLSSIGGPYLILSEPTDGGGVLALRVNVQILWDLTDDLSMLELGETYIVDQERAIIAHPEREAVFTMPIGAYEFEATQASPYGFWSGYFRNFKNEWVFGIGYPVEGIEWLIFSEVPAIATLSSTQLAVALLGGGLIILAFLLNRQLSQNLQKLLLDPLEQLDSGAERIGQGDLSQQFPPMANDEIGQLANTFNLMAARLEQRQEALAQARDEAISANRFKTQLVANVSHDLRTPLTGILGFADMLREGVYGPISQPQDSAVERIMENANRLIQMVNNLLEQAQLESGKITLQNEPFSPKELVVELDHLMQVLASRKGIEFTSFVDPALPSQLVGDRQRLHQMMMNLTHNAIKFTSVGHVHLEALKMDDQYWAIQVSDTGTGIPQEFHATIFKPFQQIDSSTTRQNVGVGLGLAIVKQLVEQMKGEITLDSTPNQGSVFTIKLPLKAA